MKLSNWKSSGKPQEKSKRTPKKHRQWLAAHKILVKRLKEGIGESHLTGSLLFI